MASGWKPVFASMRMEPFVKGLTLRVLQPA